ncbi:hypothetical protein ACY2L5_002343 [Providencia rettgeri]|nr:hypothetical protein [Providencia rettgeri]
MQNNTNPRCDLAGYIQRLKLQPPQLNTLPQRKAIPTTENASPTKPFTDIKTGWMLARDNYLNHIMACRLCVVAGLKQPRYCQVGEKYYQYYQCATHELIECQ